MTTAALLAALRAPFSRARLSLLLWAVRLLPVLLFFGLPARERLGAASAMHPDAGVLLDASADASGFAYAFQGDLMRGAMSDSADRIFWLVVASWLLVTVLSGGIAARLIRGEGALLADCGRYAGRFFRLGMGVLLLLYVADAAVNTFLQQAHAEAAKRHHTQDFALGRVWARGLLDLALVHLLGVLHCYARIELVRTDGRSAAGALLRAFGILLARLPRLLLLEAGLVLLAGLGVLLAMFVGDVGRPLADSTWLAVGLHLALLLGGSYVRTAWEVGALEARCLVLGREPAPPAPPALALAGTP